MGFLTDRAFITGVTKTNLFHLVDVNDFSQGNPDGSSYKGSVEQFIELLNNEFVKITGDTMTGSLLLPSLTANTSTIGGLNVTGGTNTDTLTANTAHTGTLIIDSTPNTDVQLGTEYLTRDSITGEVKIKQIPGPTVYGLFAQTGNSIVISATTVEGSVIDGGIGSLSVPSNGFSVGDSFRADFGGVLSVKGGGDTLRVKIKSGSIILSDSGLITLNAVTNGVWQLNINFTIRQIGGPGVASIVTLGNFHNMQTSGGSQEGFGFNTVNNTTFDTTSPNVLDVTVQWGTNNASNKIYSDIFILNKIF